MSRQLTIPNVFIATASLKIIDESDPDKPIWKTIGKCIDTPNAIQKEVTRLRDLGHTQIWSFGQVSEKRYLG